MKTEATAKMTKSQRKNREDVRLSQSDKNISGEKNEDISTLKSEFRGKTGFVNLNDFPQLSSSSKHSDSVQHTQSNRSQNRKSWLSIVSKGNIKNFSEEFPSLPSLVNKSNGEHFYDDERVKSESMENNYEEKTTPKVQAHESSLVKEGKSSSGKKIFSQPPRNPFKKKRSDPVLFNFQGLLTEQKLLKKSKKNIIIKNRSQQQRNKEVLFGNYLDSSNPQRSRGKHREIKKKKLTKLKLAIIKERIIKQKLKGKSVDFTEDGCFQLVETLDFKSEVKSYLEELNKKKKQEKSKNTQQSKQTNQLEKGNSESQENTNTNAVQNEGLGKIVLQYKERKFPEIQAGGGIKFTSKFREYCDNILTPSLDSSVSELIKELVKFQDRQYARDPIKAKAKKRHVSGIREVKKYLTLKKVKLIVIVPNLEKLQMEGGVYDSVNELKSMASEQSVPYAFALNRYMLGRCTKKNVPVSAFAVLNYEGVEKLFESTLQHLHEAKEGFIQLTKGKEAEVAEGTEEEDVNAPVISSLMSVFREGLQLSKDEFESKY